PVGGCPRRSGESHRGEERGRSPRRPTAGAGQDQGEGRLRSARSSGEGQRGLARRATRVRRLLPGEAAALEHEQVPQGGEGRAAGGADRGPCAPAGGRRRGEGAAEAEGSAGGEPAERADPLPARTRPPRAQGRGQRAYGAEGDATTLPAARAGPGPSGAARRRSGAEVIRRTGDDHREAEQLRGRVLRARERRAPAQAALRGAEAPAAEREGRAARAPRRALL